MYLMTNTTLATIWLQETRKPFQHTVRVVVPLGVYYSMVRAVAFRGGWEQNLSVSFPFHSWNLWFQTCFHGWHLVLVFSSFFVTYYLVLYYCYVLPRSTSYQVCVTCTVDVTYEWVQYCSAVLWSFANWHHPYSSSNNHIIYTLKKRYSVTHRTNYHLQWR